MTAPSWIRIPNAEWYFLDRASGHKDYILDIMDGPKETYVDIGPQFGVASDAQAILLIVSLGMTPKHSGPTGKIGVQAKLPSEDPPTDFMNGAEDRNGTLFRNRTKLEGWRNNAEFLLPAENGVVQMCWFGDNVVREANQTSPNNPCTGSLIVKVLGFVRDGSVQPPPFPTPPVA